MPLPLVLIQPPALSRAEAEERDREVPKQIWSFLPSPTSAPDARIQFSPR